MSSLSTNSSTSSSSLYSTSTSSKRVTGLMSGLDTDELVKQLTIGLQNKIDSQLQKKQLALWQQTAYQNVTKAVSEFQSKYFASASSSSSILNAGFFNSSSITNTSSYVSVSGSATAAQSMKVASITSLAKQASYTTTGKVSSQAITTGEIKSDWVKSAVTGSTMKITYGGKDYTLTVGTDGNTKTTSKIAEQINQQLKDLGLEGKISATGTDAVYDTDGKVTTASSFSLTGDADFTIKSGSDTLLKGLGLTANSKGTKDTAIIGTGTNEAYFKNQSIAAGSKLNVTLGEGSNAKTYALTLTSAVTLSVDGNNDSVLQTALNSALKSNTELAGKLNEITVSDGKVTIKAKDSASIKITGSQNLLNGLGIAAGTEGSEVAGTVNTEKLSTSYLSDTLAGSTLTFNLNGLSKTITFDESAADSYNTVSGLKDYLNTKLSSAFGSGKVTITDNGEGGLSFTTAGTTDVLTISSSSKSGVLGTDGALKVYAGESNRINLSKSLRDVQGELTNGDDLGITDFSSQTYKFTVNGKEFTFKETDTINSIINKINNDADANVTVSYSSTLDRFSITAKSGGSGSQVNIQDVSGNLANVLFSSKDAEGNYATIKGTEGQDAVLNVIFDGDDAANATEITRSSNSFTMDGVNFELLKTTPFKTDESGNPTETPDIEPITFTSQNKTDDLVSKIKTFVDDYNAILTTVNGYITEKKPTDAKYLPLTDAQKSEMKDTQITDWEKKAKQGLLFNDSLLSSFAQDWRHGMTDVVSSMGSALYELGISSASYSDNGKLTVDEEKLQKALNADPDKITQLFTGTDGIATRMKNVITKYTNDSLVNTGLLVSKAGTSTSKIDQSALAKKMKEYDTQVSTLKLRLTSQQEYYYNKFTALETYISQMNSQASFFTSSSST